MISLIKELPNVFHYNVYLSVIYQTLTASINIFHLEFFRQNGLAILERKPREKIELFIYCGEK